MRAIPEKFKKLIIDSFRTHAWNMGVSHYTADIHYMAEPHEDDKKKTDTETPMAISVLRRYQKCVLKVYPAAVIKWLDKKTKSPDRLISELVAHECAHILTMHMLTLIECPYKDSGEVTDAHETLTEMISRISVKLENEITKKTNGRQKKS